MGDRTMNRAVWVLVASLACGACTDRTDRVGGVQFDDCSGSSDSQRCAQFPSGNGTIGSGPIWRVPDATLGAGFVDGTRLILAVRDGFGTYGTPGNVYAIDLVTGDRSIVSGVYTDARYGDRPIGNGPSLEGIVDVQPFGGAWFASADVGIVRIDPATGDRTLFYDARATGECGTVLTAGLGIGSDGTIYTAGRTTGGAPDVVAIASGSCRVVSAAANDGIGNGPAFDRPTWFAFDDGRLFVGDSGSDSILSVNTASGDRVRVSSADPRFLVGAGDARIGMHPISADSDGLWTSSDEGAPVQIDPSTGDRQTLHRTHGPAVGDLGGSGAVWVHPNFPLLVEAQGTGVVVLDALTGESNWLSR